MASDGTMMMTVHSSCKDEDYEYDIGDGFDRHHSHPHNLSRLSVCTSSTMCGAEDDNLASMCMSHLSIESFQGDDNGVDADGEFSDGKDILRGLSFASDDEIELWGSCNSLPATPPRRRNKTQTPPPIGVKEYASENEARKETKNNDLRKRSRSRKRRGVRKDRWGFEKENSWDANSSSKKKKEESDESGSNGTGVMVITRPKGGKRSLCMDLEEVKACRDLGFELEHEHMLEIPSRLSFDTTTTSSGANSPIAANWRISAPGDDPRDVKARLKVWAQAVALASASSKYGS